MTKFISYERATFHEYDTLDSYVTYTITLGSNGEDVHYDGNNNTHYSMRNNAYAPIYEYVITGIGINNTVETKDGTDYITVKGAGDTIDAGRGHDQIRMDPYTGRHFAYGGDGNDEIIKSDSGNGDWSFQHTHLSLVQTLAGGNGRDYIQERNYGYDTYFYGDNIDGTGSGNDLLVSVNALDTRWGRDELNYGGTHYLYGNAGNDILLSSGQGLVELHGGTGNDYLYADEAGYRTMISGGDGDDVLINNGYVVSNDGLGIVEKPLMSGGDGDDVLMSMAHWRGTTYSAPEFRTYTQPSQRMEGGTGDDIYHVTFHTGTELHYVLDDVSGNDRLYVRTQSNNPGAFSGVATAGDDLILTYTDTQGIESTIAIEGYWQSDGSRSVEFIHISASTFASNDGQSYYSWQDVQKSSFNNNYTYRGVYGEFMNHSATDNVSQLISPLNELYGTDGADQIHGTDAEDLIHGLNGDDKLWGGVGNDQLIGDGGDDRLYGSYGDDQLTGGDGVDRLYGDSDGSSAVGSGNDTLDGGAGKDYLYGHAGSDLLLGDNGADRLYGGLGDDVIHGGSDSDMAYGGDGNDVLFGDSGSDSLYGDDGADTLDGGTGDDKLYGMLGDDILIGGLDDDRLYGAQGDDHLSGGEGVDRLYGDSDGSSVVGAGADTLEGGAGNDFLYGHLGDDLLFGDSGADRLYGDLGNDTIHGGADADMAYGGEGNDLLFGDDGSDTLYGNEGADSLLGGSGSDKLYGMIGDDVLDGGGDDDRLYGAEGNDVLLGGDGVDRLYGDSDGSSIVGNGDDTLNGGEGADYLYGHQGDDLLIGGAGNDRLYGAEGADVFYFGPETGGIDSLKDFSASDGDKLDVQDLLAVDYDPITDAITDFVLMRNQGGDAVISVDVNGSGTDFTDIAVISGFAGMSAQQFYQDDLLLI